MTFVDTNVLLDLVTADTAWADWSRRQLETAAVRGPVLINGVAYAELSVGFVRVEEVDAALSEAGSRSKTSPGPPCSWLARS